MELICLWTEKYKTFNNFCVTLNPKYKMIKASSDKDNMILEIQLKENKKNVNLFDKNLNVTAIAGVNGSGKTNLTDIIYSIIQKNNSETNNEGQYGFIEPPDSYCLVFKKDDKFSAYTKGSFCLDLIIDFKKIDIETEISPMQAAKFRTFFHLAESARNDTENTNQEERLKYKLANYFYFDRFNNDDISYAVKELLENPDFVLFKEYPELMFEKEGLEYNINFELSKLNAKLLEERNKTASLNSENAHLIRRLSFTIRRYMIFNLEKNSMEKRFKLFIHNHFPVICFETVLVKALEILNQIEYTGEKNEKQTPLEEFLTAAIEAKDGYEENYIDYWQQEHRVKFYNTLKEKIVLTFKKILPPVLEPLLVKPENRLYEFIDIVLNFEEKISAMKKFMLDNFEFANENQEAVFRTKKSAMAPIQERYKPYNEIDASVEKLYGINSIFARIFNSNFYKIDDEAYSFKNLSDMSSSENGSSYKKYFSSSILKRYV